MDTNKNEIKVKLTTNNSVNVRKDVVFRNPVSNPFLYWVHM